MADETLTTLGSTFVGYVGATAVGGVIESVSGHTVLGNFSKLRESLKKYKPDGNHEIQEAVLRSYLQATLQVSIVYGENLGISANACVLKELLPRFLAKAEVITRKLANPTLSHAKIDESLFRKHYLELPNDIKTKAQKVGNTVYTKVFGESPQTLHLLETPIENLPDEEQWLRKVIEEYTELLTQLSQSKLDFPAISDNPELNELLGEKGLLMQAKDAKEREDIIREKMLQRVEQELENKFNELPQGFHTFFLDNWFNYFCGCFHYQLARSAELARKFQSQLLADIEADTEKIINAFEKFSGEFGERLKGIEENLAWLEDKQEQGFDEIKQLLFSMMPLLATVKEDEIRTQVLFSIKPEFDELVERIEDVVRRVIREELQPKKPIPTELVRNLTNLDANVFGRKDESEKVCRAFQGKDGFAAKRFYLVVAPSGFGKSFVLVKTLQEVTDKRNIKSDYAEDVQRLIRIDCRNTKTISEIVSEFSNIIGLDIGYPNDLGFPFAYLNGVLFHFVREVGKVWLILDNFEAWLDGENNYQPINRDIYAFLEALFKGNHTIRGVFLSQSALHFESDEHFEVIDEVSKEIAEGLPEKDALEMLKINGKKVGLNRENDERLKEFLAKTAYIPQAVTSLIGYLETIKNTPNGTLQSVLADFTRFDEHEQKDGETHTQYLISKQIKAQSANVKLLLQAISFFDQKVPYEALRLLANDEDISRLVDHNLATLERDIRGSISYDLHAYFRKQTLKTLPKFEDTYSDLEVYAVNFGNKANELSKHGFLQLAADLYELAKMIFQHRFDKHQIKAAVLPPESQTIIAADLENNLAAAYMNKGVSLDSLGRLEDAITEYDTAIKIRERLVNELNQDQFANALAMAYMNKGVSLNSLGRMEDAITEYDAAIKIYERLVNELNQDQFANNLAMAYVNKGNTLSQLDNLSEATEIYGNAISLWEESLQTGNVQNLPNLIKAFRIRTEVFIKLEDWQNVGVDVGRAFDLEKKYKEHLSDHFKQLIGQDINRIIIYLKEVSLTDREKVYGNLGEFAELVKSLV